MDFFASQDAARKKSRFLVLYFAAAIAGLILALYAVLMVAVNQAENGSVRRDPRTGLQVKSHRTARWWDPMVFLWASGGTLGVIALGSGYKTMQLSGGGSVVARDLGGRLLDRNSSDPDERKLLNVVEEMSIASGMPVPDVYLLDEEDGVNAFAAGRTPGDAIVGVTRGAMRLLSRDELQGVIAHEFSHILNGDMKLNLRLIGLVHGILIMALIGRILMRSMSGPRSSSNNSKGDPRAAIFLFGLALMILGYLGVLFGRIIKAAVSRQREFLADASAVQFTRHPEGIAGALRKIGGLQAGSRLATPKAEEASHLMFSNALSNFPSLFATHPPLPERIRAILPQWDGSFPEVALPEIAAGARPADARMASFAGAAPPPRNVRAMEPFERMGAVTEAELAAARSLFASLPPDWHQHLRSPAGAQAMMFALLMSQDEALRDAEVQMLRSAVDEGTLDLTLQLQPDVARHSSATLIAVIDLAIPALRRLMPAEYHRFKNILHHLMASDQRLDLFEFMVQKILRRHLDLWFNQVEAPRVQFTKLPQIAQDARLVLSTLASVGGRDDDAALAAFSSAQQVFAENQADLGPFAATVDLQALDQALDRIDRASPLVKKSFLYACGRTVMTDASVTGEEAELLRAVADTIGCPIPPFVTR
ncbi:MAG: M48 family metallopeptidase [Verrucomicrobiales bacterium]|nr:M48 family metallopeptidase [Verrucomicrobiales bacterium]